MNPALATALRLARHPVNDLERYELGGQMIPHLQPGENVDTGALRILADRVEWLEKEAEECRVMLHDVAAGRVDSRVRQERDAASAQLAESRTENGRQAATIAELLYAAVKPERVVFETTNAGRAFGRHFQAWMASRIDPSAPHTTFGGAGHRLDAGSPQ